MHSKPRQANSVRGLYKLHDEWVSCPLSRCYRFLGGGGARPRASAGCRDPLYRAMASAVLGAARSKSYGYAARDLLQAGRLVERVTDWNGLPDREEFMRRLRQEQTAL